MSSEVQSIHEIPVRQFDVYTDTRDILFHAQRQKEELNLGNYVIVDIDSHHVEVASWNDVVEYIEDPVIRYQAKEYHESRVGAPPYGMYGNLGMRYQDVGGRISHHSDRREAVEETGVHRDVVLSRRAMECIGIDYMVVFPTGMLNLGMHPQTDMEVLLARAYNRWLVEKILKSDHRLKSMLYLPISEPDAALKTVEEFAGEPGVIGFMVTSVRNKPVHHNQYMKLYAALEERSLPLAFHGGYSWTEPAMAQINRFIGVHALGFVFWNMLHMSNWILNGVPERFPDLKVMWIESGLAWVPFMMQRLDNEYLMRTSEAPLLKRLPSEYMREMYYSSQPLERNDPGALEVTCRMINAESQLLYASDWPHWDFDLPSTILNLSFLTDQAKRNILGETSLKLFNLERPEGK